MKKQKKAANQGKNVVLSVEKVVNLLNDEDLTLQEAYTVLCLAKLEVEAEIIGGSIWQSKQVN